MVATSNQAEQPKVRAYWQRYWRRAVVITIIMQLTIAVAISLALIFNGFNPATVEFIITMIAVVAATIGGNILLVSQLLLPLKDLSAALTHVSGEPNDVQPPNPNARQYQRDGFTPLLMLIYTLATDENKVEKRAKGAAPVDTLTTALDQSSASMIVLDANGAVIYASKNAPVRTDNDNSLQLELIFEDEVDLNLWLRDNVKRLVHSEKTWLRVANKVMGEEDRRLFDISASYEKGSKSEVVLMLFDRTEIYQPEDEQLDFISFAAHELRGPVTVIRGYLDVLSEEMKESSNYTEQEALLSRLTVSANRLSGYISNILNASRFDRRHMKIHLIERTLTDVYDAVSDDMVLRASTQNRLLNVTIPDDLPTVAADQSTLSEVFANLIDNAIKYSNDGGSINVTSSVAGDFVKTDVVDQGIGMPSNVVGNLFHKFYRSHRSRETVAGTGIGLYISKGIIESHGGTIEVRSAVGEGSTFSFTVPIYATVADKLAASDNTNEGLLADSNSGAWIKNHSKFRG